MKQNSIDITERVFEDDILTNDIVNKYYIIKKEIEASKLPPTEKRYIAMLQENYQIEMSVEEFQEVQDYAENDYPYISTDRVYGEMASGTQKRIKYD